MSYDSKKIESRFPRSYSEAIPLMLSAGGPRLLIFFIFGFLFLRIAMSDFSYLDAFVIVVFIFGRSFMEWGLHVYIFNSSPLPIVGWKLNSPIRNMHHSHHLNPQDIDKIFFGWKGILFVILLSFCILSVFFGGVRLAASGVFAVSINLLLYEWCHLVAHSPIMPRSAIFRNIVENHRHHHFEDGSISMGVSSIMADRFFGTYRAGR